MWELRQIILQARRQDLRGPGMLFAGFASFTRLHTLVEEGRRRIARHGATLRCSCESRTGQARARLHMAGELCNAALEGQLKKVDERMSSKHPLSGDLEELKRLIEGGYEVNAGGRFSILCLQFVLATRVAAVRRLRPPNSDPYCCR